MQLRKYQHDTIDAIFAGWANGTPGNYLAVLPTGTGKSVVIAELVRRLAEDHGARILMLTHVAELITQNFEKLMHLYPNAPVGIFSAGLNRRDLHHQIVYGSIQSVSGHVHKRDAVDIVIIDEAHRVSDDNGSRYRKTLATLKLMNPDMRVIGFTATPYRLTSGSLIKGDDRIFDCIIYDANVLDMINQGFLSPLIAKAGRAHIDTAGVAKRGGEFVASELEASAMAGDITDRAVADLVARGSDRRSWIVFATGVAHAKQITESLVTHGINAEMVTGATPKPERMDIISRHKAGGLRALVNVEVLTTGYDNPGIDLIACLRPTGSPGLWVQMLGRGLRIAPGKTDCLVLDYTDNAIIFGPIDKIKPPSDSRGSGDGVAPCKECEQCTAIIHAALAVCPYCGYEFPKPPPEIQHTATEAPLLSVFVEPTEHRVEKTWYSVHSKPGKDACVKVEYQCGLDYFTDWIFPKSKYRYQYIKICTQFKVWPVENPSDWVALNPEGPHTIWTIPDGKYTKVVRREFYPDKVPF